MSENGDSADKVNILMVDDQAENLLALESLLEGLGQNLVRAQSGKEALRHLLAMNFAVIILDVQMPEMDGFETAALIRERERSRYTPIIFLTAARTSPEHIFKGYSVGAVDYLIKPVVPEILRSKVLAFAELAKKTSLLEIANRQLSEAQQDLRETEAKFRTLVEQLPAIIYLMDSSGTIIYISPQIESILGFSQDDCASDQYFFLNHLHPDDRDRIAEEQRRNLRGAERVVSEYRLIGGDGQPRWVHDESVAVRDEHRRLRYRQGFILDITARKSAEEERAAIQRELALARDELEIRVKERTQELAQANQELETLLYVASHDLKEPLRSIENFSLMLKNRYETQVDEKGKDYIRRIVLAVERLRRLIDELLLLSRTRRIEQTLDEVAGDAVVRAAMERLADKIARTKGRIQVEKNLPMLRANKTWATEALYNLIDNALKFASEGSPPDVEIGSYPAGFVVRDRGPGVPPGQTERIFQLFQRAVGREIEGTGAGLAIVRQIAERYGGRAWVQPRPGGGSEFFITFGSGPSTPIAPSAAGLPAAGTAGQPAASGGWKKRKTGWWRIKVGEPGP